ncbi:MFS transporter [Arcanobacterium phocae]|uniref:Major Facilitator Superfamily protein n=2 Tax=Arcanobacterium phocae TaxID=131112 RepID=A0A1H2LB12_9ACTO|nr:MFS transporter [Arcanobacterium phocae]SDU78227.1 Major Facilitator Superfamily protein [Arcanobacterium phocae]
MTESVTSSGRLPKFLQRGKIGAFLTIVLTGQLVYVSFEAFKGALLLPLSESLGISIDQFGILFGWIGIAMFFYVPAGWVNNRFTIRSILIAFAGWRLVTFLILYLVPGIPFKAMVVIAASWGIWDAIGWPAVVNGVVFIAKDEDIKGRGLAMGLLETIRRALEFAMNAIILVFIGLYPDNAVSIMKGFGIGYALLLIPIIIALLRYVPKNAIAKSVQISDKKAGKNVAALAGLINVLLKPRVWMAGMAAMCLYWTYVNLIYLSAPYIKLVFNASDAVAGAFGIFNTGLIGVFAGLISGIVADYVFKSSTVMLGVSLAVTAGGAFTVSLLPAGSQSMWLAMVLLMIMAIGIFMGKAVILAPIAELHLPEHISGSAMSVGSFAAFASVLWAHRMTAGLVEAHKADPYVGYQQILWITVLVAAIGAACAIVLAIVNNRLEKAGKLDIAGDNEILAVAAEVED